MARIRLNKYIANNTDYSRRGADDLIEAGKIEVNGQTVKELGTIISDREKVIVDGKPIKTTQSKYVIFHKPSGYITTRKDEKDRKTIYDILPDKYSGLKPAGRLDRESTGLIILTNDGELIQSLTHPKLEVPKVYLVSVQGKVSKNDVSTLQKGIKIEEGQIAYAEAQIIDYLREVSTLQVVLYQGYNRQIRKMFEKIEHPVISLKRVSHGNINIGGLKRGEHRYLKPKEVKNLQNYLKKKLAQV